MKTNPNDSSQANLTSTGFTKREAMSLEILKALIVAEEEVGLLYYESVSVMAIKHADYLIKFLNAKSSYVNHVDGDKIEEKEAPPTNQFNFSAGEGS